MMLYEEFVLQQQAEDLTVTSVNIKPLSIENIVTLLKISPASDVLLPDLFYLRNLINYFSSNRSAQRKLSQKGLSVVRSRETLSWLEGISKPLSDKIDSCIGIFHTNDTSDCSGSDLKQTMKDTFRGWFNIENSIVNFTFGRRIKNLFFRTVAQEGHSITTSIATRILTIDQNFQRLGVSGIDRTNPNNFLGNSNSIDSADLEDISNTLGSSPDIESKFNGSGVFLHQAR